MSFTSPPAVFLRLCTDSALTGSDQRSYHGNSPNALRSIRMVTTTEAARLFNKTEPHIRRLCKQHDLGSLKYGRIRLLRQRDISFLKRHFDRFGRNRKKVSIDS